MNTRLLPAITMVSFLIGAVDFCALYAQDKNPTHAPVVVRGGSVEFLAPLDAHDGPGWASTATNREITTTQSVDTSKLSLSGVKPVGGTLAEYTASGPSTDWKITLVYRNSTGDEPDPGNTDDDNDPQKVKLYMCSADGCTTNPYSGSQKVYVYDKDNIANVSPDVDQLFALDKNDLKRYSLKSCTNPIDGPNSYCNHLVVIRIKGFDHFVSDTGVMVSCANNVCRFKCRAGLCDIGVGQ